MNETAARHTILNRSFFAREAATVARELIGKILVHRIESITLRARIVETEAYIGQHDLACHASKGRTPRTEVMFGEAGHAYVYFIYGMHEMLNIVTGDRNDAQAVLIRAAETLADWPLDRGKNLSGPGRLARGMEISRVMNGIDLTRGKLFVVDDGSPPPRVRKTKRIGVGYSKHWQHRLLRFIDVDSAAVSGTRAMRGKIRKPIST